jgi:anti-sigma factor RsiW
MMDDACKKTLPLLDRLADGEGRPDEALSAARHLSDCTACRIQLARRRRLAAMLDEGLVDSLPVGEEFVQEVMDNLPQAPPPAPKRKRKRRRGLKLAGLAGLVALARLAIGSQAATLEPQGGLRLLPQLELPLGDGLAESVLRIGGVLMMVFDRLAAGLPAVGGIGLGPAIPMIALALLALAAACGSAGALALSLTAAPRAPRP